LLCLDDSLLPDKHVFIGYLENNNGWFFHYKNLQKVNRKEGKKMKSAIIVPGELPSEAKTPEK